MSAARVARRLANRLFRAPDGVDAACVRRLLDDGCTPGEVLALPVGLDDGKALRMTLAAGLLCGAAGVVLWGNPVPALLGVVVEIVAGFGTPRPPTPAELDARRRLLSEIRAEAPPDGETPLTA
jgi:hypothetical protein